MRTSLFSLRSGTSSAVGSPAQTPTSMLPLQQTPASHIPDDLSNVEPLSLPPPASSVQITPVAPRSRPLTRLPFRKATQSPASRDVPNNTTAIPAAPVPTPTASPVPVNVSYLDTLGLKLGEAVNKALVLPATHPTTIKTSYIGGVAAASGVKVGHAADDAVVKGKKPLPLGRGRALGALIACELNHASSVLQDPFLHRAILRLLQRPLTVLTTNLTEQVTNLILTPEFAPSVPLSSFNPTQIHALALAHFASELLETFDALALGRPVPRSGQVATASDSLRSIKEGLENVVTKVVAPFVGAIKAELSVVIVEVEKDSGAAEQLDKSVTRVAPLLARVTFAGEGTQSMHVQSVLATLEIGAIWTSLVALANRALPRLTPIAPCIPALDNTSDSNNAALRRTVSEGKLRSQPSDGALSTASGSSKGDSCPADYSKLPSYITPPDTPQLAPVKSEKNSQHPRRLSSGLSLSAAVNGLTHYMLPTSPPLGAASQSSATTTATTSPRQLTPPSSKKISLVKLPSLKPLAAVHAPSPPPPKVAVSSPQSPVGASSPTKASPFSRVDDVNHPIVAALQSLARDAHTVVRAINRLPVPVEGGLARDAVDEALKEMTGFVDFVDHLAVEHRAVFASIVVASSAPSTEGMDQLMEKTRETPMLLALPILLRLALAIPSSLSSSPSMAILPDTVSGWIGLADEEYRRTCLSGFAKADECAPIVGKALLKNPKVVSGAMAPGLKVWLERSVKEEEEDSSDDED